MNKRLALDCIKLCTGLYNIKGSVENRHCNFIDKLRCDVPFSSLLLVYAYSSS